MGSFWLKDSKSRPALVYWYAFTCLNHIIFVVFYFRFGIARRQMRMGGGVVTFFIKGGYEGSRQFLQKLKLFKLAVSLGNINFW